MGIKKITAKNMREGIALIKQNIGPNAVILQHQETEFGVEFTVADEAYQAQITEHAQYHNKSNNVLDLSNPSELAIKKLQFEIMSLKDLIEIQLQELVVSKSQQQNSRSALIFRKLVSCGFSEEVAKSIGYGIKDMLDPEDLFKNVQSKLLKAMPVVPNLKHDNSMVLAVLGGAGVGKTTVVAKLAAQFSLQVGAENIAIISSDLAKIGGSESLKIYANILQIPMRVVNSREQLQDALHYYKNKRYIFIDTSAITVGVTAQLQNLVSLLQVESAIEKFLVLPANLSLLSLTKTIEFFQATNLAGSIVTKLDEAINYGSTISTAISLQLPITYISNGTKVPDDLEPFVANKYLNQILATAFADLLVTPNIAENISNATRIVLE